MGPGATLCYRYRIPAASVKIEPRPPMTGPTYFVLALGIFGVICAVLDLMRGPP